MSEELKQASTEQSYEVSAAELPLCCPSKKMAVWDAHPRVYLPLGHDEHGSIVKKVECPYCGATYHLVD